MSCVPAYGDYSLTDNWYTLSEMKYNCTSNNPSIPIKVTNNEISFAKAYVGFNTDDHQNLVFNKNDLLWSSPNTCSHSISQMPYFNEVCPGNVSLPPAPKINSMDCSINTNTPNQECIIPIKKVCPTSNTIINSEYPNACKKAYNTYDLNPSTNPLVIKDLNINQGIQNQITDNAIVTKIIIDNNDKVFSKYYTNDYNINDTKTFGNAINKILQESPIKLGCCSINQNNQNQALNITIRSPLSPDNTNPQDNKFGFQHRTLTIPPNTCPTYMYAGSDYCNAFMQTTCENVQAVFNKNPNVTSGDLINYAPECACYAPNKTGEFGDLGVSIQPVCYKNGCDVIGSPSYLDPVSRKEPTCSINVCQDIYNAIENTSGTGITNNNISLKNDCSNIISTLTNSKKTKPITNSQNLKASSSNKINSSDSYIEDISDEFRNNIMYIVTGIVFIMLICIIGYYVSSLIINH